MADSRTSGASGHRDGLTAMRRPLPFSGAFAIGLMALIALLAFVAYRGPDMMVVFFAAWKLCM